MSDFTYRPQHVDYLGFLEAQLRDLQGIDRLAYELIQNADDVQVTGSEPAPGDTTTGVPPTYLCFDVTGDALVVENDAVFRPLDFQRLQRLAGGGKREEPDTTGAFGLGFIAVYQVTDAPQIFSDNLHWTIQPDAPPERRIQERPAQTTGTRFVLPWAFDEASPVRRALRIEAIDPRRLDAIARELAAAIAPASFFLKRLRTLEVRRNGVLIRRQQRRVEGRQDDGVQRLAIDEADGQSTAFLLLGGDFAVAAGHLRREYPWQIEEKRHSDVTLAIPLAALPAQGRLFAVLPTDSTMPLPIFVNADFFPTTDRRRIHLEEGYQARWNEQALVAAAQTVAANLDSLRQALQPTDFWLLLHRALLTAQATERGDLPAAFAAFWHAFTPTLSRSPILYTANGDWLTANDVRIVEPHVAHPILQALGIIPVHAALEPVYPLLRRPEIGVLDLTLGDLRSALQQSPLAPGKPLALTPAPFNTLDAWRPLWRLVDDRLAVFPRHEQREQALRHFGDLPLLVDHNMTLVTLRRAYRGDNETRALFPDVTWLHDALHGDAFPARFVPQFGARQAVEYLSDLSHEQMQEAWQMGRLDLPRLFRWFEARQIEIFADDPALQREIRNLPLAPVDGELRPLAHLYIPGGFEDPLKLAAVVDLDAFGGRRQFLRDLGLQELDFDSYVQTHIPRVLSHNPDLPSDARHELLHLLAERLGHIRDDDDLHRRLSRLPLIPSMDGSFRPARDVYASREAAALLGPRARIAEPPSSQAVVALYRWLGVRNQPSAADLIRVILDIASAQLEARQPLPGEPLGRLIQCWQQLDDLFRQDELSDRQLSQLRTGRTLPNRARVMSEPGRLYFVEQPDVLARFDLSPANLDKYLLHEALVLTPLIAAAGALSISAALHVDVAGDRAAAPAPRLEQRLAERRPLITRLLHAAGDAEQEPDPLHALRALRILQIPGLQLRTRLELGRDLFTADPQPCPAAYIARTKTLFVDAEEQPPPWAAIARELAALISPAAPAAGLALGIRELLSAATYEEAAATLDELGYP